MAEQWKLESQVEYSPSSMETVASAWQKQITMDAFLMECINRLRQMDAGAGSALADSVPYQFKVNTTNKTLLMRNAANSDWVTIGYIDKNFLGIEPITISAVKNDGGVSSLKAITEEPSIGSNGDINIDTAAHKMYMRIAGKWELLFSKTAADLTDYNTLIKSDGGITSVKNADAVPEAADGNNGDIIITDTRMYQKRNGAWQMVLSKTAADLTDYADLIRTEHVSETAEAGKIPKADGTGKLANDIAGSPDKIAGKAVSADGLADGTSLVYRIDLNSSNGGWQPEKVLTDATELTDYDTLIKRDETANTAKANKIIFTDSSGKLPVDITGSPDKLMNKTLIVPGTLTDGTTPVYRSSADGGKGGFTLESVSPGSVINDTAAESVSTTFSAKMIKKLIDQAVGAIDISQALMENNKKLYPVGSIYCSMKDTNPADIFGFGTWEQLPAGHTIVAAGEVATDNYTNTFTAGETGGEFVHQLTVGEMPAHNHSTDNQGGHNHDIRTAVYGGGGYKMSMGLTYEKTSGGTDYAQGDKSLFERGLYNLSDRYTINVWMTQAGVHAHTVSNTGGGQAHNIMQSYAVCHIFRRVT